MKGWTQQAIKAAEAPSVPQVQRNRPAPTKDTKDTKAPVAARQKPENTGEDVTPPPTVAETHYIGRYQLNVANGTHYPGRMRAVLVGPTDPKLLDYLTAALHQYTKQP